MINTVPPTSNSTHIREKCFKYNNIGIIIQWLHGTVVKDLTSLVVDSEGVSSNHGKALLLHLKHFFPHWLVCLYSHCWSFKVFVIEEMLSIIYANFLLFHVFIVSFDLKSHPFLNLNCILKVLWSFNMSTHSRYFFFMSFLWLLYVYQLSSDN